MHGSTGRLDGEDAVAAHLVWWHPPGGHHRRAGMGVCVDQLLQAGNVAEYHVVRQDYSTGFVAYQRMGLVDRVTQPQRFFLLDPRHMHAIAQSVDLLHDLEELGFVALPEIELEL